MGTIAINRLRWSAALVAMLLSSAFASPTAADSLLTPPSSHWGLEQTPARVKFEKELLQLFDSAQNSGKLGLTVWSPAQNRWLHTIRPDTPFTPASTLKLLTTAAALETFSAEWHPHTAIHLYGDLKNSRFNGRLQVLGRGDPNLSGRFYTDPLEPLRQWADTLRAVGIDTIVGAIEVDRSWFPDSPYPETWVARFRNQWYGAEISALSFNDNCALLRVLPGASRNDSVIVSIQPELPFFEVDQKQSKTVPGKRRQIRYALDGHRNKVTVSGTIGVDAHPLEVAIPVRDSHRWFEAAFREALHQSGLVVIEEEPPLSLPLYGQFQMTTAPLSSIVTEINTRSHNFYAETLLRLMGAEGGGEASVANGHRQVNSFLKNSGIDTAAFILKDGSGLSFGNRVEPRALNKLLQTMLHHPQNELWWNSLAWPGAGLRMRGLAYPYRTRFKTGFVGGVQGLAGYIATALGDTLSVVLYINGYKGNDQHARNLMDALWTKLVEHEDGERKQLHQARLAHRTVEDVPHIKQRLMQLSSQWIGTPYQQSPTGEGAAAEVSDAPLIRLDGMDCVTLIENSLALATAPTNDSILSTLNQIRYRNGEVSFANRNHFFVDDWLANNQQKGVVQLRRLPGDTLWNRTMGRRHFAKINQLPTDQVKDQPSFLYLLPREQAIAYFDTLTTPQEEIAGVGLVGKPEWLWVTHTGFLLTGPHRPPTFRHASSVRQMVIDQNFADYLRQQKGVLGVVLFDFL